MDSSSNEVVSELHPLIRVYKDGRVERLFGSPHVPPLDDPKTGVSSKDITISKDPNISARFYLPKLLPHHHQKLPLLVYFHGGGFCVESAFSLYSQTYLNALVSQAKVVAVSVEYRLAPEHPLPIAYQDCWAALQWVCSHSIENPITNEPWLINHGDFNKVFIGGDSAGANIAHNIAMRAGMENLNGGIKIHGAFLSHPYFWGSQPICSESITGHQEKLVYRLWKYVYPSSKGGIDDPMVNPFAPGAPSLDKLGCCKLLVCVAGDDNLRDRGVRYCDAVRESCWKGQVEVFEVEGEGHAFHIFNPHGEKANKMFNYMASFLNK